MQTRLDFLGAATLAALAPVAADAAASPSPAPAASPAAQPTIGPLPFDLAAFDAALETSAPHKHLFAATKLESGLVLGQMRGTLKAYAEIGTPLTDVRPAAVFYHGGSIMLAFDDAAWNAYFIPMQPKTAAGANEYSKDFATVWDGQKRGNPCLHKTGSADDTSIEGLTQDGARFFVCNNAAKGFAGFIARALKKSPLEVYRGMVAHLLPNAMLVPAGVWAVHAVQERHYTLLQTT